MSIRSYTAPVVLTTHERAELEWMVSRAGIDRQHRVRASIILFSDDRVPVSDIASMLSMSPRRVRYWRRLFGRERIEGLFRPRRPQAPRKYALSVADTILALAVQPSPSGERWWTAKLLAAHIAGVSPGHVWRVIRKAGVDLLAGWRRTYRY